MEEKTNVIPESLRVTPQPDPLMPEQIAHHIKKITSRHRKLSLTQKCFLEFVQKRANEVPHDDNTFAALRSLIRGSKATSWRESVVCSWTLGNTNLTDEQKKEATTLLAYLLDYQGRTRGQWHRSNVAKGIFNAICWGGSSLAFLIAIGFAFLFTQPASHSRLEWLLTLLGLIGVFAFLLTLTIPIFTVANLVYDTKAIRLEAARSLGLIGGAEGVPALLRASQTLEFFLNVGREALVCTLPSLAFERHYGALESDVVPNLCRLLDRSFETDLIGTEAWRMTLIGALEQVGDARALDSLKRVAQRASPFQSLIHATTIDPLNPLSSVSRRAGQVLQILQERAARETEQKTLLRGSEAPVLPATLLRSYEGTLPTPPEQLLRATTEERDEGAIG